MLYVILTAGVDVNIRNMHNGISLHIALAGGAKSCVELLLSIGADLELNFIIQDFILLSRYMLVVAVIKFLQFLRKKQVDFVQRALDKDNLIVSFCSRDYSVLANEVVKVIPLDR
ncbi:E3 ubiquitin-protein ligase KEG [Glycine soja]